LAPLSRLLRRRPGRVLVRGRSMEPTLYDGDHLVVVYGGRPRPGHLAVVRLPGAPLSVKRLAFHDDVAGWWVERDNPAEGVDSWQVGSVPDADVVATVLLRSWPLHRRTGS
jgi:phage repressor protein C with HTH and peptisase S24 domain